MALPNRCPDPSRWLAAAMVPPLLPLMPSMPKPMPFACLIVVVVVVAAAVVFVVVVVAAAFLSRPLVVTWPHCCPDTHTAMIAASA